MSALISMIDLARRILEHLKLRRKMSLSRLLLTWLYVSATPMPSKTESIPDPRPGLEKLEFFAGDWFISSMDDSATSVRSCGWHPGGYLLQCTSHQQGPRADPGEVLNFFTWDSVDQEYTNHLITSAGRDEFVLGSLSNSVWSWRGQAKWKGQIIENRATYTQSSPTSYAVNSRRLVDGKTISNRASNVVRLPMLAQPSGWSSERIGFPLPFAPTLPFRGLVDLRFPQGMFDESSPELWSDAFVWWLEGEIQFDATILNESVQTYYEGLTKQHGTVSASLVSDKDVASKPTHFSGTIQFFDTLATQKPMTLNAKVTIIACGALQRTAIFFEISPQPQGSAIGLKLEALREGFRCDSRQAVHQ
jgi:hypothetical protein